MKISGCPICKHQLEVRQYHCPECDISINGRFERNWPDSFSASQLEFIKLFLLVQGNLKELQKKLGITYPTIKNRLAEINRIITRQDPHKEDYSDILADLDEGFVTVDEAIAMISERREK
jgi:hypothetical protein